MTGLAICAALSAPSASASITDFNNWTRVEDPPHAGMSGVVNSASQITLTALGAIPNGTDVGFQSVNGGTVATSSAGYYFSASADFSVAVDFALLFSSSAGAGVIGFGIGEDGAGVNSAGIGVGFVNGSVGLISGAARIGDVDQPIAVMSGVPLSKSGRLFVSYESASGDITYGISATPGSASPTHSATFAGLENQWSGDDLIVSFFLRGQAYSLFPSLSAGKVEAVFSNFDVLQGTAISAVPVPAAIWLLGTAFVALGLVRRR